MRDIKRTSLLRSEGEPYRHFLVVGAGLSYPAIPLASEITKDCQEQAKAAGITEQPTHEDPLSCYSHWFSKAFPNPIERQEYLAKLISPARIPQAVLRLAHVLESGRIAKLVITPNFDELVTKALSLFRQQYIVCDHPKTTQRIDPARTDVAQVVHVHGTHQFYDCCNLTVEIRDRSRPDLRANSGMSNLLDRTMANASPIVIGYSGWEGDVIMSSLRRSLEERTLPILLYWFCYHKPKQGELPDWLTNHNEVRIVVPPESHDKGSAPAGGGTAANTLAATDVLQAMIRSLDLKSPKLFADPLSFFADSFDASILQGARSDESDIYSLDSVRTRIKQAVKLEEVNFSQKQKTFASLQKHLMESRYADLLNEARGIDSAAITDGEFKEVVSKIVAAVESDDYKNSKEESYIKTCDYLLELLGDGRAGDEHAREFRRAWAINRKSFWYFVSGMWAEAIPLLTELIEAAEKSISATVRAQFATALYNRGVSHNSVGEKAQAEADYRRVIELFDKPEESVNLSDVVYSYLGLATLLCERNDVVQAREFISNADLRCKRMKSPGRELLAYKERSEKEVSAAQASVEKTAAENK